MPSKIKTLLLAGEIIGLICSIVACYVLWGSSFSSWAFFLFWRVAALILMIFSSVVHAFVSWDVEGQEVAQVD